MHESLLPHTGEAKTVSPVRTVLIATLIGVAFLATGLGLSLTTEKNQVTDHMRDAADKLIHRGLNEEKGRLWNRLALMCDTYGSRFSGSPSLENALSWVAREATADGLKVIEQDVMVPVWRRGAEWGSITYTGPNGVTRVKNLTLVGLGMGNATNGVVTAPVLVVSSLDELRRRSEEARGKIVVFNNVWRGYERTVDVRRRGGPLAASFGAVGVLVKSVAPYGLQAPHTGASPAAGIGAAAITAEDAAQIQRMYERAVERPNEFSLTASLYLESTLEDDKALSRNIIIDIPGTEFPDQYVVIGGHMDSWDNGEGAMDDGGGALAAWQALKMVHDLGLRPRRTLRAVLFTNEENGNQGGEKYAHDYADTLPKTSLALESDIGAFQPYRLSFTGSSSAMKILKDIGVLLRPIGAGGVQRGGAPTLDIEPMCDTGVPCSGLEVLDFRVGNKDNNPCKDFSNVKTNPRGDNTESYFWYHHTSADTVDKIDPEQLQATATAMAVWAYSVASLNGLLPR